MELSVREARAQFAFALETAAKGERVTITRNGKPIAELGPPAAPVKQGFDWAAAEQWRKDHGYDQLPPDERTDDEWFADFNDPSFTEVMMGKFATDEDDLTGS